MPIRIQLSILMPIQIWIRLLPKDLHTIENEKFLGNFFSVQFTFFLFFSSMSKLSELSIFWKVFWNFIKMSVRPKWPERIHNTRFGTTKIIFAITTFNGSTVQINNTHSHLGFSVRFFVLVRTESTTSSPWQVTWKKNNKEISTSQSKPLAEICERWLTRSILT
jgi:hypothetical protein